ncbi:D-glycero-beta-D-manno-heptose 1,7-bisphosphate 7-phosphatase [Psychrosphaera sp. 1_MG-2023]|uniref:D-glycero-beta-D-manno-heptose 1,7-bisphosphate 7-phosphatase n=1 Tax=Psychrosphaera sp. 1_MG-2023 TaxID=3062643 RepID=UPI0026E143CE|nr:D-glycero-beta-D-manno-heptose 1,7-bisphosphate 7-phosphatase [Psychrosphaera sp. 1_MG-2023]MDO6718901.1 D-glycero-beta-D-manno-heptose 1,7-bisphosphate 7-phosphatase [Psychrosphaera sp. 1_MG-2023]
MTNKILFLDRDGVVNVDHGYLYEPEKFEFIDGVFAGCKKFQQAGFQIIVITNQSGIGRGYYTEQDFANLSSWMIEQFAKNGIKILDVFYCPHHPEKANPPYLQHCDCRKPAPGMLLNAQQQHQVNMAKSIMVGDKGSDMKAAVNAGVGRKFLVTSGQDLAESDRALADKVFSNLEQLADFVC